METDPWLYAALGAVAVFHLGLIVYWARRTMGDATTESEGHSGEGALQCPECGTANAVNFQYCKACVADLSGATRTRSARSDSWNPF